MTPFPLESSPALLNVPAVYRRSIASVDQATNGKPACWLGAGAGKAKGPKQTAHDEGLVNEIPRVRVSLILATELGEELAAADLEIERQRERIGRSLLEFDERLCLWVNLQDDRRLRTKVP